MLNFIFGLKNHIVIIFRNERRIKMKFKEIEIGKSEQIRALLTGIEERGAKAGTRYLVLNFTDGEQTVTANYWNCTRDEFTAKEGQVLDLRVDAKLYKGRYGRSWCNERFFQSNHDFDDADRWISGINGRRYEDNNDRSADTECVCNIRKRAGNRGFWKKIR